METNILKQWSENQEVKKLGLATPDLLKMLRCIEEDRILEDHGFEIEHIYKFIKYSRQMEVEDLLSDNKSEGSSTRLPGS